MWLVIFPKSLKSVIFKSDGSPGPMKFMISVKFSVLSDMLNLV